MFTEKVVKPFIFSFNDFKSDFYARFKDLTIFDVEEFNAVKIVLDGLKTNYFKRKKIKSSFDDSYQVNFLKRKVKEILKANPTNKKQSLPKFLSSFCTRKILLVDNSLRLVPDIDGKNASLYFENILKYFGQANCLYLSEIKSDLRYPVDIFIPDFKEKILLHSLDQNEKKLWQNLKKCLSKIKTYFTHQEFASVQIAFDIFFNEYRAWNFLLKFLNQKKIIIISHYHHEGAILAMKRQNREIIELQHGLISSNDIFYCFPEAILSVRERALFPQKICVFGSYWKKVLLKGNEFQADQIIEVGNILAEINIPSNELNKLLDRKSTRLNSSH